MIALHDSPNLSGLAAEPGLMLDTSPTACARASMDFGGIAEGASVGVVRPESPEQVSRVIQHARRVKLQVTVRCGGLGQSGQSVGRGSLTLDTSGLKQLGAPNLASMSVWCGAGVTWRELLRHLRPHCLVPVVLPLNLDLTIGGSLSAGCFGSASHRWGPGVSQVKAFEFVAGTGEVLRGGPEYPERQAVLAGVGRFGVLTRIAIPLRRKLERTRTYYLLYRHIRPFLDDQRKLALADRIDHLEGLCAATVLGLKKGALPRRSPLVKWSYSLQVSVECGAEAAPGDDPVSGLSPDEVVHVEENETDDFLARYDGRFEFMRATGAWQQKHPWLECVLPWSRLESVVPAVLDVLPPFLGDGHRLAWVADGARPISLAFPSEGPFATFGVLPTGVPPALFEPAMAALRAVDELLRQSGGKRYLSGWIFDRSDAGWRAHFGERAYAELGAAKQLLDPDAIFTSTLFP